MSEKHRNRNRKPKGRKLTASELKREISRLFRKNPRKRLNAKQIIRKLKIKNSKDSVHSALEALAEKHFLHPMEEDKFRINPQLEEASTRSTRGPKRQYEGYVDMTRSGACLLYTSPSPRDRTRSRMPSSA